VAQTVTIGEQKVSPESESFKFSATPTPQVQNPSDSSTPTPQPCLKHTLKFSIVLYFQANYISMWLWVRVFSKVARDDRRRIEIMR